MEFLSALLLYNEDMLMRPYVRLPIDRKNIKMKIRQGPVSNFKHFRNFRVLDRHSKIIQAYISIL